MEKIVFLVLPMAVNYVMLFQRKTKWVQSSERWVLVSILFLIGLTIILSDFLSAGLFFGWGLLTPLIFSYIDLKARELSFKLHKRDLYLWLRGSSDIDHSFTGGKHVKPSDRWISIGLLCCVVALPLVAILFK